MFTSTVGLVKATFKYVLPERAELAVTAITQGPFCGVEEHLFRHEGDIALKDAALFHA